MQSTEYPDLKFVTPRSWRLANRMYVQLIVIHDTEGSEHALSAEDGAAYDAKRTDGTSTHYFHDVNSTVQCVLTKHIAHTARAQGNLRGIHHELCGKASQGVEGWADANSQGTLRQAARQCARDSMRWDIPVRHLTVDQVRAGAKGFCSHWDITRAFPEDKGTHTDPGPDFPWSQFLDMVREELGEDMPLSDADVEKIWKRPVRIVGSGDPANPADDRPVQAATVLANLDQMFRQTMKTAEGESDEIVPFIDALPVKVADEIMKRLSSGPDMNDMARVLKATLAPDQVAALAELLSTS
jgi:hypothetical protein